jgi:hypothetical protein
VQAYITNAHTATSAARTKATHKVVEADKENW